jgi:hypothetical protein
LTGDVLDLIGEFLAPCPDDDVEKLPDFIFVNKTVSESYLLYTRENLSLQDDLIRQQIQEMKEQEGREDQGGSDSVEFILPEDLEDKQLILAEQSNWEKLIKNIQNS